MHANAPTPDDATILSARTVAVLPVLTTGNRVAAYRRLSAVVASAPAAASVAVAPVTVPSAEGFGFAGQATAADVVLLNLGAAMASATLASATLAKQLGGEHFSNSLNSIQNHRSGALAQLSSAVLAQVDRFITAARAGEVDLDATVRALAESEAGIGVGPARAHGYFTVGLWMGLASVFVANGLDGREIAEMAGPLATFLEKDAIFGGADTKLAGEVRTIGRALSTEKADKDAWQAAMLRALEVRADAP